VRRENLAGLTRGRGLGSLPRSWCGWRLRAGGGRLSHGRGCCRMGVAVR